MDGSNLCRWKLKCIFFWNLGSATDDLCLWAVVYCSFPLQVRTSTNVHKESRTVIYGPYKIKKKKLAVREYSNKFK